MDNFTGLNPTEAKNNIDNFFAQMIEVSNIFLRGGNALFDNLRKTWCSKKAVEFSDKYGYLLFEKTVTAVKDAARTIARNAETAYDTIAIANGADRLGVGYGSTMSNESGVFSPLQESGDTGIVGMNIMQVNLALAVYGDAVE